MTAKPTGLYSWHVPALDGLRGIAVLLVVLTHTWRLPRTSLPDRVVSSVVSIGWSGVELFFVLSGFLITGILLDFKGGHHYFRNFYARRVLRIFPLYYAMLALTFVAAPLLPHLLGRTMGSVNGQQLWYIFHLSNFSMAAHGTVAEAPLGVSWSLSVEEQFYLAWPFVVWVLPRRRLLRLCLALVLLSFARRVVLTATHVSAIVVYLLTPSQLGAIAIGGAVAIALRSGGGIERLALCARWALVIAPFLVVAIGLTAMPGRFSLDPTSPLMETFGMLILQLLYAAAIVAVLSAAPLSRCLRLIETRALMVCGRWSFGMYLWHTPLIAVIYGVSLRRGWPPLLGSALPLQLLFTTTCIGITVTLAALSWRFYEQPIIGLKRLFPLHPRRDLANDEVPVD